MANFVRGDESHRDWELRTLREGAVTSSGEFWVSIPESWEFGDSGSPLPVLTFEERRQEYEKLGFDCVEVHRGREKDLFDAGKVRGYNVENNEVIVARFVRRP